MKIITSASDDAASSRFLDLLYEVAVEYKYKNGNVKDFPVEQKHIASLISLFDKYYFDKKLNDMISCGLFVADFLSVLYDGRYDSIPCPDVFVDKCLSVVCDPRGENKTLVFREYNLVDLVGTIASCSRKARAWMFDLDIMQSLRRVIEEVDKENGNSAEEQERGRRREEKTRKNKERNEASEVRGGANPPKSSLSEQVTSRPLVALRRHQDNGSTLQSARS
eukprot:763179-Hanusia_phi.AAC.11